MPLDMNPEIRAQWCAALRSGEYRQATQHLKAGNAYCCLGVLTDLWLKAGNDEMVINEFGELDSVWTEINGSLSPPVVRWAGLSDEDPFLKDAESCVDLNDHGSSFAEIADLIDGGKS